MKHLPFLLTCLSLFFITNTNAQLRLPALVSSGMVLQQNDSVNLWGWAGPSDKVYVTTSWDGRKDSTVTSNGAKWKLKVKTPKAGGPYSIEIKADRKSTRLNSSHSQS